LIWCAVDPRLRAGRLFICRRLPIGFARVLRNSRLTGQDKYENTGSARGNGLAVSRFTRFTHLRL
jgi:hypothetical protein